MNKFNNDPSGCGISSVPFPTALLPADIAEAVRVLARLHGVPEALPGACALGVVSAAIGRGLAVQSRADRLTFANIYVLASVRSGTGKSEVLRSLSYELQRFQSDLMTQWKTAKVAHRIERRHLARRIKRLEAVAQSAKSPRELRQLRQDLEAAEDVLEAVAPQPKPRVVVEDVTAPKLALLLAANRGVLASMSSEAGCIIDGLIRRSGRPDRLLESLLLKAYSVEPFYGDRVAREVSIEQPCLTAVWLAQPHRVRQLYEMQALAEGGLLPRIMPVVIDERPGSPEEPLHLNAVKRFQKLVAGLLEEFHGALVETVVIPTPAASHLVKEYERELRQQRIGELADVECFVARWPEWVWRLSVILHAAKWENEAADIPLDESTVRTAIALAEWFAGQQLALVRGNDQHVVQKKQNAVLALLNERPDGITPTDVCRKRIEQPAHQAKILLAGMEAAGLLNGSDSKPPHGGHITRRYARK